MIKQTIIRLIPFRLRTPLRALYRSLKYRIGVLVGGRDPLIPPDSLHSVGPGHYVAVGFAELMGIANGYQRSRALTVATELGIADLLRGGPRPVGDLALATDVWTYRERHPEENEIFNAAMAALSRAGAGPELVAYDFGRHRIIADIAGGTGVLLSAILRKHPESRGILFDQPHVVAAAR